MKNYQILPNHYDDMVQGFEKRKPNIVHYSKGVKVLAWPREKLKIDNNSKISK